VSFRVTVSKKLTRKIRGSVKKNKIKTGPLEKVALFVSHLPNKIQLTYKYGANNLQNESRKRSDNGRLSISSSETSRASSRE